MLLIALQFYNTSYILCIQVDIIVHLIKVCGLRGNCMTVLTPYSAQVECIKGKLKTEMRARTDSVKVQTINDSQG